jgi:isopenicillin-N N-acyltransferase-like protein
VLNAERFEDAPRPVTDTARTCSANFVIGAAGGKAVDIESSPDHVSRLDPQDGVVTHSNHFLTEGHGESLLEKISPNTLYRADRMRALLQAHRGALSFAHMRRGRRRPFRRALRDLPPSRCAGIQREAHHDRRGRPHRSRSADHARRQRPALHERLRRVHGLDRMRNDGGITSPQTRCVPSPLWGED